jgi:uncharacterized cupredoxin-like copper-binding protein
VRKILASAAAILALASAAACSPGPRAGRQTVELTIRHSRFQPSELSFAAGATVRFVIRNTDPIDHEFILGDREVQDRHEDGTEAHHGAIPGEVSVPAGQVATTTFRFAEPGMLLIGCHLPGHWDYGMRGLVVVD